MITLPSEDLDRIIEMAWEDRTPFEAIEFQFGLSEPQVIAVMRQEMKASSFKLWRKRVSGRKSKHAAISRFDRFSAGGPAGSLQQDQPDSCPREILPHHAGIRVNGIGTPDRSGEGPDAAIEIPGVSALCRHFGVHLSECG